MKHHLLLIRLAPEFSESPCASEFQVDILCGSMITLDIKQGVREYYCKSTSLKQQ